MILSKEVTLKDIAAISPYSFSSISDIAVETGELVSQGNESPSKPIREEPR